MNKHKKLKKKLVSDLTVKIVFLPYVYLSESFYDDPTLYGRVHTLTV